MKHDTNTTTILGHSAPAPRLTLQGAGLGGLVPCLLWMAAIGVHQLF
ncbi:hypothetical protein [Pseudooceanicola atlanticus]|nr:hypothetical protein [Pseudooceanicola atlanticus]